MSECYNFEMIEFNDGFLNECVDATYIIHLENNGRFDSIITQLQEYHPTNKVFILFNRGYKKCKKSEKIIVPAYDLIDAFFQCFEHAEQNAYRNILILEDDFMFSEKIKEREHVENICNFINNKEGESFIYRLGCIPYLQFPYQWNHSVGMFMGGTHAVIYTKSYCDEILKVDRHTIYDWDIYNNFARAYTYYTPLCYQLFPETENSKYWGFHNPIFYFSSKIIFAIYQLFGLNTSIEPGYTFFYMFSKILFFVLVGVCFLILWLIIHLFIFKKTTLKGRK
jgi:hypothetical protein